MKIDYLDFDHDDDDDLIIHSSYFPGHRWLHQSDEITLSEFDSAQPQDDGNPEICREALKLKQEIYMYAERIYGEPPSVSVFIIIVIIFIIIFIISIIIIIMIIFISQIWFEIF